MKTRFSKLGEIEIEDCFIIDKSEVDLIGPENIRQIAYRYGRLYNKKFKVNILKDSNKQIDGMLVTREL
jgi:hypothetical protein